MACVVLVGGIPGSGKSKIIDHLIKNKNKFLALWDLCDSDVSYDNEIQLCFPSSNSISTVPSKLYEIISVSYDELATFTEQQKLIHVPNGWKDFRKDFLDAVDCYISYQCHIKYELQDISSRAKTIFDYLINKYSSCSGSQNRPILLVEDNFYYSSMRYKWFQVSRKHGLGFCQIFLDCKVGVALRRNNTRLIKVPENIIHTMSEKLELPDPHKNLWEKYSFIIDTSKEEEAVPVNKIVKFIKAATGSPPEPVIDSSEQKKEAQAKCSQSVIHQADKILRRLTGQVVIQLLAENRSKEDLKILTSKINEARQKLLRELSAGTLSLPLNIIEVISKNGIENQDNEAEKYLYILLENKIDEMLKT